MAKRKKAGKKSTSKNGDDKVALTREDKKTLTSLKGLADGVVSVANRSRAPHLEIPSRSLSNVRYNQSRKIIEMGSNRNRRELFNLSQAKSYMQTLLVGSGCKQLIESGKTTSIRGLYYMLKHTIDGTKEETFDDQGDCDPVIEDLEVTLDALREELHLYASNRGNLIGDLTLLDLVMDPDGNEPINCLTVGRNGFSIPSIVEPNSIKFLKCNAKFILHVEKDTVYNRFVEDRFFEKYQCLLTHGSGQPPRGVRRMLFRLHNELKLPVYCLLDNDPWGYYIYSVIKQGSINLAFESRRMAIPAAKYMGLRSKDYERCELNSSVTIKLSDSDKKRIGQIARYPWFEKKKMWQREFKQMLSNDFKLEVESLINRDLSYVTEEYVPQRLTDRDFLD
ncbi:MAG: DNA topoisomerase IV subunit A [Planctomycetaceae bacterium]|nr:DNA topoisomerase IV subunit A [Planctomycetaceae bacterium]MCP4464244.1 DNA topoisomerase IV subunit A [Planctomycetaceae bacterium]MDG1808516.1 DNA topoisomerase IV subunit A [Pirellulaceae bacterium]MDG2102182.1 DNA topoisomerase IV subunit A [Pirellulaceae bacterium]